MHVPRSPASVLEAPAEAAELFAVAKSPATMLETAGKEAAELFAGKTLGG